MQQYESEFLELRQQIKESIRKKTQDGNAIAPTSEQRKRKLPYNDFGSFFGPSQPVIASRVLQESKSLKLLASKMLDSIEFKKISGTTSSSGTKNASEQEKRKAEKLRDSRDYSFLFSDDAELPVSRPVSSGSHTRDEPAGNPQTRPSISKKGQPSSRLGSRRPVDHRRNLVPHQNFQRPEPMTCVPRQQRVEQRKASQGLTSSQMVPRQSLPPSISKPPLKQPQQLKKKKLAKTSEEDELAMRMIRQMCKTDRYAGRDFEDYDDRGMEASLEDIIKEEKRSEKLAKKEDAEQLRLIKEENRRERVRKEERRSRSLAIKSFLV